MPHEVKIPTYHRLLSAFKAVGPYLRQEKCEPEIYFFDCLSVCVDDTQSPETREFWGWWMLLIDTDNGFQANYQYGRFDVEGNWVKEDLKEADVAEIERTRSVFHDKLTAMLAKDFELSVELDESELVTV
ncbi:sigma factor-binding protein Crl [Vibrio sp. RC27]